MYIYSGADPDLVKVSIRLGKKITDDMVIKRTSETHQTRRIPPEIRDMSTLHHTIHALYFQYARSVAECTPILKTHTRPPLR